MLRGDVQGAQTAFPVLEDCPSLRLRQANLSVRQRGDVRATGILKHPPRGWGGPAAGTLQYRAHKGLRAG